MIDWSQINWVEIIAQFFGLLQSACCIIGPYFKYRWQMLINSMVSVSFLIINLLLLSIARPDSPVNLSGIIINSVALVVLSFSLWHVRKGTQAPIAEKIIFFAIFLALSFVGYEDPIDILPALGAVFFMLASFQHNEQKTRVLYLFNTLSWFSYHCICKNSAAIGQAVAFTMYVIALYRYSENGKKKQTSASKKKQSSLHEKKVEHKQIKQ